MKNISYNKDDNNRPFSKDEILRQREIDRQLYVSAIRGQLQELQHLLQEHGGEMRMMMDLARTKTFPLYNNETLLHAAAKSGRMQVLRFLIDECQLDIESRDKKGMTPMLVAASFRNPDILRVLMDEYHCNVKATNTSGETVLHFMCSNHVMFPLELIRHVVMDLGGTEMLAMKDNRRGHTPLHKACYDLRLDVIQFLVEECHVPVQTDERESPLALALASIRYGLDMLADSDVDDVRERRAALLESGDTVIHFLVEANPRLNADDVDELWDRPKAWSWESRWHWVACYCEAVHDISRETTEQYPLHSILQCDPLLEHDSLSRWYSFRQYRWIPIFEHFGANKCLSRRRHDGKQPLQVYLDRLSSSASSSPPNLEMLQALFQVEPRTMIDSLVDFSNSNPKDLDTSVDDEDVGDERRRFLHLHPALTINLAFRRAVEPKQEQSESAAAAVWKKSVISLSKRDMERRVLYELMLVGVTYELIRPDPICLIKLSH